MRQARRDKQGLGLILGISLLVFVGGALAGDSSGETTRVSIASSGEQAVWGAYAGFRLSRR
jgi:hypothetical protein